MSSYSDPNFKRKRDAYVTAYTGMFQYVINELEGGSDIWKYESERIAEDFVEMELDDVIRQSAANGIEDALGDIYASAKRENVHNIRIS